MDRFDWIELEESQDKFESPQYEESHFSDSFTMARNMRAAGHFRAAVEHYKKAIGLENDNHLAWLELIDTLVRARQLEQADQASQKAQTLFSGVAELYASRALVLSHLNANEPAKIELERGYVIGDRSWYFSCVQAEIILRDNTGYSREALKCLEKATVYTDSPWEAYFVAGWILLDANQPTWAAGYFSEAGHRNPTAPIVWLCLGDCFKELRLYDQALFYYEKATELEPQHSLALKRQRDCAPKLYGLLRIFSRNSVQKRWDKDFEDKLNTE